MRVHVASPRSAIDGLHETRAQPPRCVQPSPAQHHVVGAAAAGEHMRGALPACPRRVLAPTLLLEPEAPLVRPTLDPIVECLKFVNKYVHKLICIYIHGLCMPNKCAMAKGYPHLSTKQGGHEGAGGGSYGCAAWLVCAAARLVHD